MLSNEGLKVLLLLLFPIRFYLILLIKFEYYRLLSLGACIKPHIHRISKPFVVILVMLIGKKSAMVKPELKGRKLIKRLFW